MEAKTSVPPKKLAYEAQLARLNRQQREAHDSIAFNYDAAGNPIDRRIRIELAGAGAGKTATTVVTAATLINGKKIPPGGLVLTTFTRAAGAVLAQRMEKIVPAKAVEAARIGTMHSMAIRYLAEACRTNGSLGRQFPHKFGARANLSEGVGVQGPDGKPMRIREGTLIQRIVAHPYTRFVPIYPDNPKGPKREEELEIWGVQETRGLGLVKSGRGKKTKQGQTSAGAGDYARAIQLLGARGIVPGWVPPDVLAEACKPFEERAENPLPQLADVYRIYERAKKNLNVYTYDDALLAYWKYGTDSAAVVISDEAQDYSPLQVWIALDLAKRGNGVAVFVGDIRQSIYKFKGASPEVMIELARGPEDSRILLEIPTNYRSIAQVVDVGNTIVRGRDWMVGGDAVAARRDDGMLPENDIRFLLDYHSGDGGDLPSAVLADIQARVEDGASLSDFAILARTNAAIDAFEMAAVAQGVPVVRMGKGKSFLKNDLIKNMLAYVRLAIEDDLASLVQIRNVNEKSEKGTRFLTPAALDGLAEAEDMVAKMIAMSKVAMARNQRGAAQGLYDLATTIQEIRKLDWTALGPAQAIRRIWPYVSDYRPEEVKKKEREDELAAAIEQAVMGEEVPEEVNDSEYEDDSDGLDASALLVMEALAERGGSPEGLLKLAARIEGEVARFGMQQLEDDPEAAALAQEYARNRVTLVTAHSAKGLEWPHVYVDGTPGRFPSFRAVKEGNLEEEIRLAYVAMTRAEDSLTICASVPPRRGGMGAGLSTESLHTGREGIIVETADEVQRLWNKWHDFVRGLPEGWKVDGDPAASFLACNIAFTNGRHSVLVQEANSRRVYVVSVGTLSTEYGKLGEALEAAKRAMQNAPRPLPPKFDPSGPSGPSGPRAPGHTPKTLVSSDALPGVYESFLDFLEDQPGKPRRGWSWPDFVAWVREQPGLYDDFKRMVRALSNPLDSETVPFEDVPEAYEPPEPGPKLPDSAVTAAVLDVLSTGPLPSEEVIPAVLEALGTDSSGVADQAKAVLTSLAAEGEADVNEDAREVYLTPRASDRLAPVLGKRSDAILAPAGLLDPPEGLPETRVAGTIVLQMPPDTAPTNVRVGLVVRLPDGHLTTHQVSLPWNTPIRLFSGAVIVTTGSTVGRNDTRLFLHVGTAGVQDLSKQRLVYVPEEKHSSSVFSPAQQQIEALQKRIDKLTLRQWAGDWLHAKAISLKLPLDTYVVARAVWEAGAGMPFHVEAGSFVLPAPEDGKGLVLSSQRFPSSSRAPTQLLLSAGLIQESGMVGKHTRYAWAI